MASSDSDGRFISGEKTVTTAGTAEALLTSGKTIWPWVKIITKTGNTGNVYIGGGDVASTTNDGFPKDKELVLFNRRGFDLSKMFIDVDTNGEGVDLYVWLNN